MSEQDRVRNDRERRQTCPECQRRGALQGIGGSNWFECSNGHTWGYRER